MGRLKTERTLLGIEIGTGMIAKVPQMGRDLRHCAAV